jgi:hypothetical protein
MLFPGHKWVSVVRDHGAPLFKMDEGAAGPARRACNRNVVKETVTHLPAHHLFDVRCVHFTILLNAPFCNLGRRMDVKVTLQK